MAMTVPAGGYIPDTQSFVKSPLLRLPLELYERICSFVLEEPLLRARRHDAFCPYSERNSDVPETPPFMIDSSRCDCTRRRNVGLLLTNRQLHAVAAPIFWRESTFCFDSAESFDVDDLREQYRDSIRHVVVTTGGLDDIRETSSMWRTIQTFKNLRTLVITPTSDLRSLRSGLPRLERFGFLHRWIYSGGLIGSTIWTGKTIFIDIVQEYPVQAEQFKSGNMSLDPTRALNSIFGHIKKESIGSAMTRVRHKRDHWHRKYYRHYSFVRDGIDHRNNPAIPLGDSAGFGACIHGLPNSEAMRKSHALERRRHEASRKARGLPTVQEVRATREAQETKKRRKEESRRLHHQFEKVMRERGFDIDNIGRRKRHREPEPEDPQEKKRKSKLKKKSKALDIREKRMHKYQTLRDYIWLET